MSGDREISISNDKFKDVARAYSEQLEGLSYEYYDAACGEDTAVGRELSRLKNNESQRRESRDFLSGFANILPISTYQSGYPGKVSVLVGEKDLRSTMAVRKHCVWRTEREAQPLAEKIIDAVFDGTQYGYRPWLVLGSRFSYSRQKTRDILLGSFRSEYGKTFSDYDVITMSVKRWRALEEVRRSIDFRLDESDALRMYRPGMRKLCVDARSKGAIHDQHLDEVGPYSKSLGSTPWGLKKYGLYVRKNMEATNSVKRGLTNQQVEQFNLPKYLAEIAVDFGVSKAYGELCAESEVPQPLE